MLDELGLPLKIVSEDGESYDVTLVSADPVRLEILYGKFLIAEETLSINGKLQTPEEFGKSFFAVNAAFLSVFSNEDEIGLLCFTEIIPGYSAVFDFIFWDRRTSGRQKLVLEVLSWASKQLSIPRFEFRVHSLAFYQIHRIYKLGAFYEGTKRKAWRYQDKVIDLHILSILSEEIEEGKSFIPRLPKDKRWYSKVAKPGGRDGNRRS